MARKPVIKELADTRLASGYGGWIYCGHCGENIGYLCYVTYDNFKLAYRCRCGGEGRLHIAFGDAQNAGTAQGKLIPVKNRLCCPGDLSPMLTVLEKKLAWYQYEIDCVGCNTRYLEEKTL